MKKLDGNHVSLKLYPGLVHWLGYQKNPDALICKLLTDYRHRRTHLVRRTFCAIVVGLMLGYGWCTYYRPLPPTVPQMVTYPDIAIDLTAPKHITSWKYKTARY